MSVPRPRAPRYTNYCLCGCGPSVTRKFRPGHDQSPRITIEKAVGGLEELRNIRLLKLDGCQTRE